MIRHPAPGQPVRIRYRPPLRRIAAYHGRAGVVVAAAAGPGPRNHLVAVGEDLVCIPAGHLAAIEERDNP
jgi:hypothetical protein